MAREKEASRERTSVLTGRCLFKPTAVSQFIHPPRTRRKAAQVTPRGRATARSVRPGPGRAYGEGQGRTRQGRGRTGPRSASGPRQAAAPAQPEQAQHRGERRGREPPGPGWLGETWATCPAPRRAAPPAPSHPASASPAPAPSPPRHTCPPRPRPHNLASRLAGPRPLRPYWRPRPEARLPLGESAPGRGRGTARPPCPR